MSADISQGNKSQAQLSWTLHAKESDCTHSDHYAVDLVKRAGKVLPNFPVTPRSLESGWTEPQIQRAGFSDKSGQPEEMVLVHEGRGARDCSAKPGTGSGHMIKTDCGSTGGRDGNNSHNVIMEERLGDSFQQRRVRPKVLEGTPGVGRSAVAPVQRPVAGSKDRHSKVNTAKGLRDRRVRLSATTAIQFFDVQDRLGYDQPSKAVDWLIKKARAAIDELAPVDLGGGIAGSGDAGAEEAGEARGGSDEVGGGLAEERLEESTGKVWQEEMGGGGGGRAESRAKARERARERAKERSNATGKAAPSALDSPPPPHEATHNLHLLPEFFVLSQPLLSSDHSSTLLRPSVTQIPPPPSSCTPLSPPEFSVLPSPPASFQAMPTSTASSQLLKFPSHFFHLPAPCSPASNPPTYFFQDVPALHDRPRPSSLHLSPSSSAAASLPGPGPPPFPTPSVISTRGTLQSIFNPVSSLSQVHSFLIGRDAAQACESGFNQATPPATQNSMMSATHNALVSRVIHGMENAEEETRMPSSMYLQ